jgi:hypothetical protein
MAEGSPQVRYQMCQVVQDDVTAPQRVQITVPQPMAMEIYYATCGKINQHNRD